MYWANSDSASFGTISADNFFELDNKLLLKSFNSLWKDKNFDYVVCK